MLGELIRKDILRHLLSLRFAIACVLCLFVMLTSFAVRSTEFAQVKDDYDKAVSADRKEIADMDHPWRMVWGAVPVHRPPNPLKVFVEGTEPKNGGTTRLTSFEKADFILPDIPNTSAPLFPSMDLTAFVGLVMSLLAILFGFDAVCGEKQQGTMRLLVSYSVPRDKLILSKWIGGYATLIVPYFLSIIVMVVITLVYERMALTDDEWTRLIGIIVLSLVYIAAVYSMALWVSCITKRAETSIMILSSIWVVMFLAYPNITPHLAEVVSPTGSASELAKQRMAKSKEAREELFDKKVKEYDKALGEDPDAWNPQNKEELRKRHDRRIARYGYQQDSCITRLVEYRKIDEKAFADLSTQVDLCRWISRPSPFACFAMASAELAGEGVSAKRRFLDQVTDYHPKLVEYSHQEIISNERHSREKGLFGAPWKDTKQNEMPAFKFTPPAGEEYIDSLIVDSAILIGLVIVFFMLSYLAILRYDVR
jgi:ABC-type transport system involved in multi-copper enzyme maturation permease subunit